MTPHTGSGGAVSLFVAAGNSGALTNVSVSVTGSAFLGNSVGGACPLSIVRLGCLGLHSSAPLAGLPTPAGTWWSPPATPPPPPPPPRPCPLSGNGGSLAISLVPCVSCSVALSRLTASNNMGGSGGGIAVFLTAGARDLVVNTVTISDISVTHNVASGACQHCVAHPMFCSRLDAGPPAAVCIGSVGWAR